MRFTSASARAARALRLSSPARCARRSSPSMNCGARRSSSSMNSLGGCPFQLGPPTSHPSSSQSANSRWALSSNSCCSARRAASSSRRPGEVGGSSASSSSYAAMTPGRSLFASASRAAASRVAMFRQPSSRRISRRRRSSSADAHAMSTRPRVGAMSRGCRRTPTALATASAINPRVKVRRMLESFGRAPKMFDWQMKKRWSHTATAGHRDGQTGTHSLNDMVALIIRRLSAPRIEA